MRLGLVALLSGGSTAPAASPSPAEEARTIVEALVACGTRHSLSSWSDTKRGIGCGRDVVVKTLAEMANAPAPPRRAVRP